MAKRFCNRSYFGSGVLFTPGRWFERLLHPYRHSQKCDYQGKALLIRWTARAQRAMQARETPLLAEMPLYFSCVVKKRVLFQSADMADVHALSVTPQLRVVMHRVEADRCDPVAFAQNYPARRELDSPAATHMRARQLDIDFRDGQWRGTFVI